VEPTISSLIVSAEDGDASATAALFAALYSELHRMARRQRPRGGRDVTLGTTTLLHEAYVKMAGREGPVFPDRGRFMAYAARVMRTVVIDHVRSRKALRRGGQFEITSLPDEVADAAGTKMDPARLARLGDAIDALAEVDPLLAQVVDLKFFCGFSFAEIAAMRGLSERTVQRHWEKARLFLHEEIADDEPA
jgi:RNA polymerase sigma factor (TIGR02999 family)